MEYPINRDDIFKAADYMLDVIPHFQEANRKLSLEAGYSVLYILETFMSNEDWRFYAMASFVWNQDDK